MTLTIVLRFEELVDILRRGSVIPKVQVVVLDELATIRKIIDSVKTISSDKYQLEQMESARQSINETLTTIGY